MIDYLFFGEAFGWVPESVDKLRWSMRKEMKEVFLEVRKKQAEEMKSRR
jgi:hypothetical protein